MNKFEQLSSDVHQLSVVGGGKSHISSDDHQMSVAGTGEGEVGVVLCLVSDREGQGRGGEVGSPMSVI